MDSNGFTACFFSLVSPESCADTRRKPVSSYRTHFSPSLPPSRTNLRGPDRDIKELKEGGGGLRRKGGEREKGNDGAGGGEADDVG